MLTLASPLSDFSAFKNKAGVYAVVYIGDRLPPPVDAYVGQAHDLYERLKGHRSKHGDSPRFHNVVKKYGTEKFAVAILEYVDVTGRTLVEANPILCEREQYWFALAGFDSLYNIAPIAGSQLGVKRSAETREKLAKLRRGKPLSEECRRKISEAGQGRPCPVETRRKISEAKRGKSHKGVALTNHNRWCLPRGLHRPDKCEVCAGEAGDAK